MVTHFSNNRKKRQVRIRAKITGTAKRPRISVFRSQKALYVQVIDDEKGITLIGMGETQSDEKTNKISSATALGVKIAEAMKQQKLTTAVFDRGGFAYHGRIKALAESLRAGGITI